MRTAESERPKRSEDIRKSKGDYFYIKSLIGSNSSIAFGFIFPYIFMCIKSNGDRYIIIWIHDMSKIVNYP